MANLGNASYNLAIPAGQSVVRNSSDTTFEARYTDPDYYKYSIVTSVASGNLTVALKNYLGDDPSVSAPVKVQIGGVVRTITSGLIVTMNAGTKWFNSGSTELATKEIDYFVYLSYQRGGTHIAVARIPFGNFQEDFNVADSTNEKVRIIDDNGGEASAPFLNIGRFNAILSAGAGYTWSIPATSVVINRPIFESRWLDWVPTLTWTGTAPTGTLTIYNRKYKISGDKLDYFIYQDFATAGSVTKISASLPMQKLSGSYILINGYIVDGNLNPGGVSTTPYIDNNLDIYCTTFSARGFKSNGFYNI